MEDGAGSCDGLIDNNHDDYDDDDDDDHVCAREPN